MSSTRTKSPMLRNTGASISIIMFCFSLFFGCSERFTSYYPTHDAAVKDGAVKRGWIPQIVPDSATELFEQHDVDTNEIWLRFNVPAKQKDDIVAGLKKLTHEELGKIKLRHPSRVNWWFEGLVEQQPANDNALSADVYRADAGYLAVDRGSSTMFYWTSGY